MAGAVRMVLWYGIPDPLHIRPGTKQANLPRKARETPNLPAGVRTPDTCAAIRPHIMTVVVINGFADMNGVCERLQDRIDSTARYGGVDVISASK